MALVRKRRYQGIKSLLKKYPDPTLPLRDLEVAREVYSRVFDYEFPFMMNIAIEMGVLKTCGIPSISKLLAATKQSVNFGHKRVEDSSDLLNELHQSYSRRIARSMVADVVDPITGKVTTTSRDPKIPLAEQEELQERANDDKRAQAAVERINFIHSHYRISQGDYLYNLAMFVLESDYWVRRFEWRPLTALERNAILAVWSNTARKMGIEDIPATIAEFEQWTEAYESEHMKYAPTNPIIADSSIAIFQAAATTPEGKARIKAFFNALLTPRLRAALGYEAPSRKAVFISESILWVRSCIVKYLMMPRTVPHVRTALSATRFDDVDIGQATEKFEEDKKAADAVATAATATAVDVAVETKPEAGTIPVAPKTTGCPFTGGLRYVPRFHVLPPIYPLGYKIEELGPHRFFGKNPQTAICPYNGGWCS
ncbi:hypothetical protein EDD11_007916 [Mortierella claussenii]|nr:hypothetical protein EDD11_007916 [Mortierella claussenii]